jgi:hypothetical protein
MTLKSAYVVETTGLYSNLNEVFELGRKFIQPQYFNSSLEDAVTVATSSPHFTVANAGSPTPIAAGYKVKYKASGTEHERTVASVSGSTFDVTVAPAGAVSNKAITYTSAAPTSYSTLLTELINAASAGKTVFTVSVDTATSPVSTTNLRLNGNYLKAFLAGIYYAMDAEGIFNTYEVVLSLETPSPSLTKIKFAFTLGVA